MNMLRALHVVGMTAVIWGLTGALVQAGWGNFYTKTQKPVQTVIDNTAPIHSICVREILIAQARYDIPDNILLGIGIQEAGTRLNKQLVVWPWAVNAEGAGHLFKTKANAMNWVGTQLDNGMRSIDVGCMQINLRWHPTAFNSLQEGFDPKINVDYAAQLLKQHYIVTGNWRTAAGRYHSKTPEKQAIYLSSLQRNIRVANAQIDRFKALAGLKSPVVKVAKKSEDNPIELPAETPTNRPFWTSDLSVQGGSSDRYRSIYSQAQLRPILPKFTHDSLRRVE